MYLNDLIDFWCFNATFNNISAKLGQPVLVVEEAFYLYLLIKKSGSRQLQYCNQRLLQITTDVWMIKLIKLVNTNKRLPPPLKRYSWNIVESGVKTPKINQSIKSLRYINYTQDFGAWTAELLNLLDYRTIEPSDCRTIKPSDYQSVPLCIDLYLFFPVWFFPLGLVSSGCHPCYVPI